MTSTEGAYGCFSFQRPLPGIRGLQLKRTKPASRPRIACAALLALKGVVQCNQNIECCIPGRRKYLDIVMRPKNCGPQVQPKVHPCHCWPMNCLQTCPHSKFDIHGAGKNTCENLDDIFALVLQSHARRSLKMLLMFGQTDCSSHPRLCPSFASQIKRYSSSLYTSETS